MPPRMPESVYLTQVHAVSLDCADHYAGQKARSVNLKEPIQAPGERVVAVLSTVNKIWIKPRGPFLNGVKGIPLDHDILDQKDNRLRIPIILHGRAQVIKESDSLNDRVDNGYRA